MATSKQSKQSKQSETSTTSTLDPAAKRGEKGTPSTPARSGWRTPVRALSAGLIVGGLLLAPLAVVGSWARAELGNTDTFVATLAPLANDVAVQDFVSGEVASAINEQLDLPGLTGDLFAGINELGLPPRSATALSLLEAPIAQSLLGLVERASDRVITSDTFAEAWSGALRVSHTQIAATLGNDPSARVELDDTGTLRLQLGPVIAAVKTQLVDQGVPLAGLIPASDRSVVIAQSDQLPTVQLFFGLALGLGLWLPWIALLLIVAGVLTAGLRRTAIIRSGIALAATMLVLSIGLSIARTLLINEAAAINVPPDAAAAVFGQLTASIRLSAVIVAVLGLLAAAVAWFTSSEAVPLRLRRAMNPGVAPTAHGSLG